MKITLARRIVQVAMLGLFCLPPLLAGWGLAGLFAGGDGEVATPAEGVFFGSLSSSSMAGMPLLDPLAALEVLSSGYGLATAGLAGAALVVVAYGLVRGRAFCGWVCPVNLIGEGVDTLRRRLGIAVPERMFSRRVKIGVAVAVVVASALVGFPVFEAVSPIGAVNKGLVFGGFAGAGTLLAIVIAELFVSRRVWCRALCPLGGLFQVLGRAGQVNVRIDHGACVHCGRCEEACPADPVILAPALSGDDAIVRAGDCMACGACVDTCPARALRFCLGRPPRVLFHGVFRRGGGGGVVGGLSGARRPAARVAGMRRSVPINGRGTVPFRGARPRGNLVPTEAVLASAAEQRRES